MLKLYDAHGDIWYDIVQHSQKGERDIFRKYQLPKFQKGGVMGGTFVMWIDPPHDEEPVRRIKEIEKAVKQELEDAADILNIVRKYEDFEKGTKEGKINVMMGLEGLSYIGEDIDQINYYYEEFGVRTMMLTWNEENALASGWPGDPERGLTAKGKEAIRRMNELGMVLDVSHIALGSITDENLRTAESESSRKQVVLDNGIYQKIVSPDRSVSSKGFGRRHIGHSLHHGLDANLRKRPCDITSVKPYKMMSGMGNAVTFHSALYVGKQIALRKSQKIFICQCHILYAYIFISNSLKTVTGTGFPCRKIRFRTKKPT